MKKGEHCSDEMKSILSNARKGKHLSDEHKAKISMAMKGENNPMYGTKGDKSPNFGKKFTEEHKVKISAAQIGKKNHMYGKTGVNHHNYGKHLSDETKEKIAEALRGEKSQFYGKFGENHPMYGHVYSDEDIQKMCQSRKLDKHPNWKGGISFEPYCPKFDDYLKLRIRMFFDNRCVVCGKTKEENMQELSCHHVEYDKSACCHGRPVHFAALCIGCHGATNWDRSRWEAILHRIIDEIYGGKSYWTKNEFHMQ
jgi:hypothetical protein